MQSVPISVSARERLAAKISVVTRLFGRLIQPVPRVYYEGVKDMNSRNRVTKRALSLSFVCEGVTSQGNVRSKSGRPKLDFQRLLNSP